MYIDFVLVQVCGRQHIWGEALPLPFGYSMLNKSSLEGVCQPYPNHNKGFSCGEFFRLLSTFGVAWIGESFVGLKPFHTIVMEIARFLNNF